MFVHLDLGPRVSDSSRPFATREDLAMDAWAIVGGFDFVGEAASTAQAGGD